MDSVGFDAFDLGVLLCLGSGCCWLHVEERLKLLQNSHAIFDLRLRLWVLFTRFTLSLLFYLPEPLVDLLLSETELVSKLDPLGAGRHLAPIFFKYAPQYVHLFGFFAQSFKFFIPFAFAKDCTFMCWLLLLFYQENLMGLKFLRSPVLKAIFIELDLILLKAFVFSLAFVQRIWTVYIKFCIHQCFSTSD